MKRRFSDILNIEGVKRVLYFSFQGKIIFDESVNNSNNVDYNDLQDIQFDYMKEVSEIDLVFEKGRIYIKRTKYGYLMVVMKALAPIALVRLNCDLLLPKLNVVSNGHNDLKRFFKFKK